MNIVVDKITHDQRQLFLTRAVARELYRELRAAGLRDGTLAEAVESLLFGITAIVDGSRIMDLEGQPIVPVLMFGDASPPTTVITNGRTSSMHEYAVGIADEVLEAGKKYDA